jgi:hypothetical protein
VIAAQQELRVAAANTVKIAQKRAHSEAKTGSRRVEKPKVRDNDIALATAVEIESTALKVYEEAISADTGTCTPKMWHFYAEHLRSRMEVYAGIVKENGNEGEERGESQSDDLNRQKEKYEAKQVMEYLLARFLDLMERGEKKGKVIGEETYVLWATVLLQGGYFLPTGLPICCIYATMIL